MEPRQSNPLLGRLLIALAIVVVVPLVGVLAKSLASLRSCLATWPERQTAARCAECLRQHRPEKFAQRKRIGRTPRNRALGVQAFEVPNQQQPEIATRREPRAAIVGIKPLAQALDEAVEVVLIENLVQSSVERMCGAARQVLR